MELNRSILTNQVLIGTFALLAVVILAVAAERHRLAQPMLYFWLACCALHAYTCVVRIRRIRSGPEPSLSILQ